MSRNPVMHKRSNNIETKFHFIWNETEDVTFSIHYITLEKIAADIFNEPLPESRVKTFRTVSLGTDSTQSAKF